MVCPLTLKRDFAAATEFELVSSSPNYLQSIVCVENAVKTAKQLMKKSKQAGTDIYLAVLDERNFIRRKSVRPIATLDMHSNAIYYTYVQKCTR